MARQKPSAVGSRKNFRTNWFCGRRLQYSGYCKSWKLQTSPSAPPPPKKIIGPVPWLGWKRVVVQLGTEHVYCGLELIGQHFTVALNFTFVRACVCGRTDVHTCASVALTAARLLPEQCADRRRLFWRSVSQPLEAHGFSPPSSPVLGGLYSFFSF